MTIEHPGLSRRTLLSTVTLGVPALGLLGAANLIGAPRRQCEENADHAGWLVGSRDDNAAPGGPSVSPRPG